MFDIIPGGGGGWRLVDPRPIKAMAPYTFFTPSEAELEALRMGDSVHLAFAPDRALEGEAERLWVRIEDRSGPIWQGAVEDGRESLPGLEAGSAVSFHPWHVVAVRECRVDGLEEEARYFARAHIDPRLLTGEVLLGALERRDEVGQSARRGVYADTGWFAFGDDDLRPDAIAMHYGPIGLVLNLDDSMMPLLRAPYGTRIERWQGGWRRVAL